jgi:hypothetical protein
MLPAQAYTDQLELSLVYPIKPGESYTIKIKRSRGLPTKDAAGKQIANPELACTLVIPGDGSGQ